MDGNVEDRHERNRRIRRMVAVLVLVAVSFYVAFIVMTAVSSP